MGTGSTYNKDLLNQKSQKFYNDLSKLKTVETMKIDDTDDLSEKIIINISLKEINKDSSYKMKLSKLDNTVHPLDEFTYLTSEDDQTANLKVPLIVNYRFEREQPLNIDIIKESSNDSKSCEIKTSLGCIMGSRKNTLQKNISDMGDEQLIVKAEKLKQNEDIINIKFDIKPNKNVSFNEIKNKMYYEIYSKDLLYRSEFLNNKGIFDPIKLPKYLFKNNNLKIKFYDCNKKKVGDFDLNIEELANDKKSFNIKAKGTKYEIISKSKLTKDFTFTDYLKSGVQIGLSVAIDFTMSNGLPNDEKSLHYIYGLEPNQYERAIFACGNIVAYYDYDQFFPCFGFGAKINNEKYELFNLNLQADPNVKYIQGIIDAYHNAIKSVELYGPTNFGPIIRKINNMIKNEYNRFKYHILMILTDGKIDDMDDTIEELVDGSFLPLSVIIIGVGNADFSSMKELDADERPLINSKGLKAARDLVQFVPFLKYESNPEQLANEVLEEIPKQLMEYYDLKNLDPTKLVT